MSEDERSPAGPPDAATRTPAVAPPRDLVPFGEAVRTWFAISLQTFGGPAVQIAVMQRALVDEKRWIGQQRFLHALNYCMLLPGPEAQQLAVYIGWLLNGLRGGLVAGVLFVLPGMAALLALSAVYIAFGTSVAVTALFAGLAPAAGSARGRWSAAWALAETTPGPLIMVVQFVTFLGAYRDPGSLDPWVAAVLGALLTTWVTIVPCFIFLGAPYVERLRGNMALSAALTGITAAVVGVIANLALYFALHTLFAGTSDLTWGPIQLELPQLDTLRPLPWRSPSPQRSWSSGSAGRCCARSACAPSLGSPQASSRPSSDLILTVHAEGAPVRNTIGQWVTA